MTRDSVAVRARVSAAGRRLSNAVPLDRRDRLWLGLAFVPGIVAVAVYLATNPYPAYGGGLYVQTATEIAVNGFAPPASIPGYALPIPFAYPPLQFYVLSVLLEAGIDPLTVTRFLPGLAVVAGLVPLYLLGRDYTGSRAAGTATAAAVALNPQVLEWHVSAGGVVRAFAFLYALTAVYAGYHAFADGSRRVLWVGAVAVAATGLSHPVYALFVVTSYLVLWLGFDRSVAGFARGLAVGLGALALASPWLAWVTATHGVGAFTAAAGTHGGVGGGLVRLVKEGSPYALFPFAAAAAALALRRDAVVAGWTVVASLVFYQPRFSYTVGTLAAVTAAVGLFERLDRPADPPSNSDRRALAAAAVVVVASAAGGAILAVEMTGSSDPSSPAFVDDADVATVEWAKRETPEDATFVVLGDAAEWFPALSNRSILVGPWGVEWVSAPAYDRQFDAFVAASTCRSHTCVETAAARVGADPDYVAVPKGRYTVRGDPAVGFGTLERSFELADDWVLAYENDDVVVYRATGPNGTGDTAGADG